MLFPIEPVGFWLAGEDHAAVLIYQFAPENPLEDEVTDAARLIWRVHLLLVAGFRVMIRSFYDWRWCDRIL